MVLREIQRGAEQRQPEAGLRDKGQAGGLLVGEAADGELLTPTVIMTTPRCGGAAWAVVCMEGEGVRRPPHLCLRPCAAWVALPGPSPACLLLGHPADSSLPPSLAPLPPRPAGLLTPSPSSASRWRCGWRSRMRTMLRRRAYGGWALHCTRALSCRVLCARAW